MLSSSDCTLAIVIPAYNEAQRLPRTLQALRTFIECHGSQFQIQEVIIVDDGSTDVTAQVILDSRPEFSQLRLAQQRPNKGKGAAVHLGLRTATAAWVLVADADMSTPWEELLILAKHMNEDVLIMGSRGLPGSQIELKQHWLRQNMGKSFNRILKFLVGVPFMDTQCGFKLIRNDLFFREKILPQLKVQRFAWDVELILFILKHRFSVREVPVRWRHQEQSRVHILRDSAEMFLTVLKLKIRLRQGQKS